MSGRTRSQASLLSRATARNSCREKYRANENVIRHHPVQKGSRKAGYSSSLKETNKMDIRIATKYN